MPKDSLKSGSAPDEMGYHSVHPPIRLGGGVGILEFRVLGGGQNILDFRGGFCYEVGIFLRGRSIHSPFIFPFWNARFQKFKTCLQRPHFQYSHFQIKDRCITSNRCSLESKFSYSMSSSMKSLRTPFHPLVGTQNQANLWNCFFIHLIGLEGPPNHPVCKARTFCINANKHGSY